MASWFMATTVIGLAALGMGAGVAWRTPGQGVQRLTSNQQEAVAQTRISFEYLVREYVAKNSGYVGIITIAQIRDSNVGAPGLRSANYPASWKAIVSAGNIKWCTPITAKQTYAFMSIEGVTLESLKCTE